jgi:hypothetical protein
MPSGSPDELKSQEPQSDGFEDFDRFRRRYENRLDFDEYFWKYFFPSRDGDRLRPDAKGDGSPRNAK